jgi:hypothetical protein
LKTFSKSKMSRVIPRSDGWIAEKSVVEVYLEDCFLPLLIPKVFRPKYQPFVIQLVLEVY